MKENNPYREDREQLRELLKQYENFKNGRSHSFIEEDSFEKIIDYYQEKEDLIRAMEAAEIAGEQFPYSSMLLIKKADILLANRRYQDALDILEQASLLDGADINLYILKTDAYLALDQQEKAVVLLEEALSLFEGEEKVELLFELADVYDDYEDFDKVFDCLKMVLEEEPNNEEALYKICFWTDFTGRNEESIRLHQHIIDEYPYNELAWFNLAAAYQGIKLYEKAIDAYKYAITIEEKFDYAYRNMGDAYIRLRKYKEAIEALEKVNELAKPEDVIFEAIGHCYDRLKNFAQARFHYRKASHLRQDDSKLFYKIACTYFNEGQWESCIKQLDTAMKIHKLQPEYNLLAGECKMQLGLFKDAVQYFSNVVRIRPKNTAGWEALIRCLYKAAYFDEALEQTEAALKVTNGKPLFLFYKASVLFALGKAKEGILQLEEAMRQTPKLLKKFVELNPSILQNQLVVDVVARFKRNKSI
ncbi:MAG: tetratricopeptide repeat protein [Chitinophagaceae bacterium]|jgi:tetratricopeptide (TPR) repeat protein|nr:tetratricopeptide repeat protein [Chitinophagaceae bacterium]MBK7679094.1 tetratricopeptide repeat protein [Chitinophagaceae bacterium]MBK8299561.1 tetratricopeptide repeat protein [Chitinophagaceae bacterium]MBK9463611.1 tetratricopeptide repeat protein [Chitinophagaceae bacterium]MBK9659268.1 tetratricopeptide repeat protein [Chitinophagaceae bacterium]